MTLFTLHNNIIKRLPDGFVIWPGVLIPPNSTPIKPGGPETSTIRVLAVVHEAKDDLPERVRQAADNFIQVAFEHLSNEYGKGMTILIPNEPNVSVFQGPPEEDSCSTILQRLEYQVNVLKRLPVTEVPGWKSSLLSCYQKGLISQEAYDQGLALLEN